MTTLNIIGVLIIGILIGLIIGLEISRRTYRDTTERMNGAINILDRNREESCSTNPTETKAAHHPPGC